MFELEGQYMKTFADFVTDSAGTSGGFNIVFETGMFALVNDLERVVQMLHSAGVPFEVIGGVAVNTHIFQDHRDLGVVTRDIDLLVARRDLDRVIEVARTAGYQAKKMVGGFALIRPEQQLSQAVHMVFSGERSKSTQPSPHPEVNPEIKQFYGIQIPVARLRELIRMKLNSFRPKDLVHLEILEQAGLITPEAVADLPPELSERLQQARRQFEENQPDIEG